MTRFLCCAVCHPRTIEQLKSVTKCKNGYGSFPGHEIIPLNTIADASRIFSRWEKVVIVIVSTILIPHCTVWLEFRAQSFELRKAVVPAVV